MKKTVKILSMFMLILMVISVIAPTVFAAGDDGLLVPSDLTATNPGGASDLKSTAGNIMGAIRNIAVIASVIIIMILGVKYMLGSIEEKAEYKKSFMPLIIGMILVVAASSIATFIFNMAG